MSETAAHSAKDSSPARHRPFSLAIYLPIVFGLSWPFQIAALFVADHHTLPMALSCVSMTMVLVASYIAGRYVFRDGFADAGWNWGKPLDYLLVVFIVLFLWLAPTLVELYTGSARAAYNETVFSIIGAVGLSLLPLLVAGFGEEFGWRGYMLPRIARKTTPRKAVLIHGAIWFLWHFPLIGISVLFEGVSLGKSLGIPIFIAASVTLVLSIAAGTLAGVVFGYVWVFSGSLAVATVFHAFYDAVRDSIYLKICVGSLFSWWPIIALCVLGLLVLWKGDWTRLQSRPARVGNSLA
jgi:membrane protease YdiL (CAAX protease family)